MAFDFQPTLADDTVSLRPLREDDFAALAAAASDPMIWEQHPACDRWRDDVFLRFFNDSMASGGALVVEDASTGAIIGSSRFDVTRAGEHECEIGWTFLVRSHWGGPTNRAVKRLMIGHVLTGFERAIFVVGEDNVRSRAAMEKIGGVLTERTLTADFQGKPVRHVVYAIDTDLFAANIGRIERG